MSNFNQAIQASELREKIIKPTLTALGLYSQAAESLLFGTCAHESHCGKYVRQVGGPALGIYQMEPATYNDIRDSYLAYRPDLKKRLLDLCGYQKMPVAEMLVSDNTLATAMCRIHYLRVKEALPEANNLIGLAAYWKNYYNTYKGKGTVKQFIEDYRRFS